MSGLQGDQEAVVQTLWCDVVQTVEGLVAAQPVLTGPTTVQDGVTAQPPRRVGPRGDPATVVQGHVHGVHDRRPPRRSRKDAQRRRPVVDQFQVPDGEEFRYEGREVLRADPPQDVVRPQVLVVQFEGLGLVREPCEAHVLRVGEGEAVQDAHRCEDVRAPAFENLAVHHAEGRVVGHEVAQRALRQKQLSGGVEVTVVARQRQLRQPGLLAWVEPRRRDQSQDRLGDRVGGVRVERLLDGRPHGGIAEDGPRPRLDRPEAGQQRMHRGRDGRTAGPARRARPDRRRPRSAAPAVPGRSVRHGRQRPRPRHRRRRPRAAPGGRPGRPWRPPRASRTAGATTPVPGPQRPARR